MKSNKKKQPRNEKRNEGISQRLLRVYEAVLCSDVVCMQIPFLLMVSLADRFFLYASYEHYIYILARCFFFTFAPFNIFHFIDFIDALKHSQSMCECSKQVSTAVSAQPEYCSIQRCAFGVVHVAQHSQPVFLCVCTRGASMAT